MEENITIEFVRNWIEKHHLTRKSYESVLTDALTNNGHYYIDNPYLRDWIRENTGKFRNILPYELNENQQIVLEWLKEMFTDTGDGYFSVIGYLANPTTREDEQDVAYIALSRLNNLEEIHVPAAFAE
ncbi:hypothetical protein NRIC_09760 [Enterococcus florum]|uniref:Uncharacterized protein n=1 Tax=Enterococcus florum TaxID=2480627 RepID=A0A4P5P5H5_9ENTE|nr:hypothetical protein [Enterococcus florum]GCF93085.1 hypothetical protein NRIC_09760 [Enterococcus florum]